MLAIRSTNAKSVTKDFDYKLNSKIIQMNILDKKRNSYSVNHLIPTMFNEIDSIRQNGQQNTF